MEINGREVRAIGWMMIKHLPAEHLQEMSTVEPCVAIDLAQLMMNFDRCYGLCIQKLYHRPHFTDGGCWNKSQLQPLQRCYCENSGSSAIACVMRRCYYITRVFFFSDKCETCLRVVRGNNFIFNVIYKWKTTVILSRILAIFLHFCEILNIRDKNEILCFLNNFYIYFSPSRWVT